MGQGNVWHPVNMTATAYQRIFALIAALSSLAREISYGAGDIGVNDHLKTIDDELERLKGLLEGKMVVKVNVHRLGLKQIIRNPFEELEKTLLSEDTALD